MGIKANSWRKFSIAGYFLALTLALRWKALPLFNYAFIGGTQGDAGLYIWLSYLTPKTLFRIPWFSTQAFYPYSDSLAFSDNFILPSLIIETLQFASISFTASYNLALLLALFLNGYCTFLLVAKRGASKIAGVLAGTIVLSFGFLTAHSGHPQLQFFFWVPLGLLFWLQALDELSRSSCVKYGFLAGLSIFLSLLCSVYYAIFLLSILSLTTLFNLIFIHTKSPLVERIKTGIKQIIPCGTGCVLGLLPAIPFVLPYLRIKSLYGERGIHEAFYFSASPLSFISSPPLTFWGQLTSQWSHPEAWFFPGFVCTAFFLSGGLSQLNKRDSHLRFITTIALALLAVLARLIFEHNPAPWGLYLQGMIAWIILIVGNIFIYSSTLPHFHRLILFLALNTAIISFGPLGNPAKDHLVFAPYMLFKAILPGLEGIRAISRIGIVTIFCIAILAGMSWVRLVEGLNRKRLATFLVLLLAVVENKNLDIAVEELPQKPLAFSHLPNDGGPLITLPLVTAPLRSGEVSSWSDFAHQNVNAMLWTMETNHPTANGYSGLRTPNMLNYPRWLRAFPSDDSVKVLKNAGIEYVVHLHEGEVQLNAPPVDGLKLMFSGEDGSMLYQVTR